MSIFMFSCRTKLAPVLTEEEVAHLLIPRAKVVNSYVLKVNMHLVIDSYRLNPIIEFERGSHRSLFFLPFALYGAEESKA